MATISTTSVTSNVDDVIAWLSENNRKQKTKGIKLFYQRELK